MNFCILSEFIELSMTDGANLDTYLVVCHSREGGNPALLR